MPIRNHALQAVLAVALAAGAAHADQQFTFTYSDSSLTATGSLIATDNGNGSLTAQWGVLHIISGPIVGDYSLWANPTAPDMTLSPMGVFLIDNQMHPSGAVSLNTYGLLFTSPGREINIWGNGAGNPYSLWSNAGHGYDYSNDHGVFAISQPVSIDAGGSPPVPAPDAPAVLAVTAVLVVRRRR